MARLVNPWPEGRTINARSRYGPRRHPISGRPGVMHHGVDVGGQFPVTAAGDGIVQHIGWNPTGGGHVVLINHRDIVTAYYHGAHRTGLRVGQKVKAGDFLYLSGSTGASTGNHLHFEVRRGPRGAWGDTMDPEDFLPREGDTSPPAPPLAVPLTGRLDRTTVRAWQKYLKAGGYYDGILSGNIGPKTRRAIQAWAGVRQDGIIGPITRRAVQTRLGVTVDGIWGPQTYTALQRLLNGAGS